MNKKKAYIQSRIKIILINLEINFFSQITLLNSLFLTIRVVAVLHE